MSLLQKSQGDGKNPAIPLMLVHPKGGYVHPKGGFVHPKGGDGPISEP